MKKHYPELETVSDVLERIPHRQTRSIANAIRVCNDVETSSVYKIHAVLEVMF